MLTVGRHSHRLKELRKRVRDRRPGEVIVDGRRLIEDLLSWRVPLREAYLAASVVDSDTGARVAAAAEEAWMVDDSVLAGVSPTRHPQGFLAVTGEPQLPSWSGHDGVAVFLDRVQEPGNVGAIVRSAAALGAAAVLLSSGCADPLHWAAVRASAGAVFRIPVDGAVKASAAARRLRNRGGSVWAAATAGTSLDRWRPAEPTLLLVGAEGSGLDSATARLAEGQVSIPLERDVDSLNVAVAVGVLLQALRGVRGGAG